MTTFFNGYDGLLCDLDGVVYAGTQPIDQAITTLNVLIGQGVPVAFVTNNASKAVTEIADHLRELGVATNAEHVMTSAQAVVEILTAKYQCDAGPVLVTGSPQLTQQIRAAGFVTTQLATDRPQVVVQGFNPKLGWNDLAQASFAIQQGAGWLATNLDLTIPLSHGIAPGNGSLVNTVAQATGTRPEVAAGKPAPVMFTTMAQKFSMTKPLVVGDRLDTDVLGAANAGYDAALVETGIHRRQDIGDHRSVVTPTWLLPGLGVLLQEPSDDLRSHNA
ncbi:HAD-IIA family hydrolase [Enteractinococcus coprophilus]|uniref:HAD superfamily hydrolase (TIGR01450 family) n=1 Tax=Enteractinococcus coprophilus TaxID=1027633 RepID=A0A543AK32_9MICC|nr:HAD-IIA family hydrolase [Enteractinococcus coprophilus]TQL72881.1 HAD superfamily hydrolase (TIGR01450 family) [Enteractinococcus coprophilus]